MIPAVGIDKTVPKDVPGNIFNTVHNEIVIKKISYNIEILGRKTQTSIN